MTSAESTPYKGAMSPTHLEPSITITITVVYSKSVIFHFMFATWACICFLGCSQLILCTACNNAPLCCAATCPYISTWSQAYDYQHGNTFIFLLLNTTTEATVNTLDRNISNVTKSGLYLQHFPYPVQVYFLPATQPLGFLPQHPTQ